MCSETILFPEKDFDGYIFDLDGTLVDSMPLHFHSWRETLRSFGAPFELTWETLGSMAGAGPRRVVELLNQKWGCDLPPDDVAEEKENYFIKNISGIPPIHPVFEFARERHAKGKPLAVATGSCAEVPACLLQGIGGHELFQAIITPADVSKGKPAPDMFFLAAKLMGVAPEKCVVFEDGVLGIRGAEAAGMEWVFIPSPSPKDTPTKQCEPIARH